MCLARACLPIGKYSTVVALKARVNYRLSDLLVHEILGNVLTSYEIECEGFGIFSVKCDGFLILH